ncbi:MAG: hypothetical protein AAGH15_18610 [Myxococcota bacterium]
MDARDFEAFRAAMQAAGTELRPPRPELAARMLQADWHRPLRAFYAHCDGMARADYHDGSEICLWPLEHVAVRSAHVEFADWLIDSHAYALRPDGAIVISDNGSEYDRVAGSLSEFLERMLYAPDRLFAG